MVRRSLNAGDDEPGQMNFKNPSECEHLFQVVDVFDTHTAPGAMVLDENTLCVKLEVAIGEEAGRTMLQRVSLDPTWKGFFATRLFLKAIGEPYKGQIEVDDDRWIGRQLYATVVHTESGEKTYANIAEYNFEKCAALSQHDSGTEQVSSPSEVVWED